MGSRSPLQGIFPNQGSNPGFLHCKWITSCATRKAHIKLIQSIKINLHSSRSSSPTFLFSSCFWLFACLFPFSVHFRCYLLSFTNSSIAMLTEYGRPDHHISNMSCLHLFRSSFYIKDGHLLLNLFLIINCCCYFKTFYTN